MTVHCSPDTISPRAVVRPQPDPTPRTGSMPRVTRVCASLAALLALVGLLGWITGSVGLRELLPGQVAIKANSAFGLLLVAVSWLAGRRVGIALAVGALSTNSSSTTPRSRRTPAGRR